MNQIIWSGAALSDLVRLHDFLATVNPRAAIKTVRTLTAAPQSLIEQPRLGERLSEFEGREVRRLVVGKYEMRYEIIGSTVSLLRIWHAREDR